MELSWNPTAKEEQSLRRGLRGGTSGMVLLLANPRGHPRSQGGLPMRSLEGALLIPC